MLPTVQPQHDADGLPQTRDGSLALALHHDLPQVGHKLDAMCEGPGLLLGELQTDLFDDTLGGGAARVPELLQGPQLPGLEKQPRGAQGPLAVVDLPGQHHCMHEVAVRVVSKFWGQKLLKPATEILQHTAMREAVVHNLHQLHSSTLDYLVQDILGLEQPRLPLLVGVEAADVVDRALLQRLQQIGQIAEIPAAHGAEALPGMGGAAGVRHLLQQRRLRLREDRLDLRHQGVIVLVDPALGGVGHRPSVVGDLKAIMEPRSAIAAAGFEPQGHDGPSLPHELGVHELAELLVLLLCSNEVLHSAKAVLVQKLQQGLDAEDHRGGVGELHLRDVQPLLRVHPLLGFQNLLHEELLQPLVGQVDAQLLEAVVLQPLEAVDVQSSNVLVVGVWIGAGIRHLVDPCNDLLKEARVENLDDALQSLPRLCQGARAFDVGDPALTVHMHLLELQDLRNGQRAHAQQVRRGLQGLLGVGVDLHRRRLGPHVRRRRRRRARSRGG
mmetsp:Transcript_111708/g.266469  ORF Transcript_111708/g.266469 Transcript_111708/m.266469 type:complete len:498 (-) Transcript_111708:1172-2665(-)